MKRYFAAAGALLLGTSTVALAADVKMSSFGDTGTAKVASEAKVATDLTATGTGSDKSLISARSDFGTTTDAKLGLASLDADLTKMASAETGSKLWNASGTGAKPEMGWADSGMKLQTASMDGGAKFASADSSAKFQTASVESGLKLQNTSAENGVKLEVPSEDARAQFAAADGSDSKLPVASGDPGSIQLAMGDKTEANIGMGGPLEDDPAAMLLTPQPAPQNYPACEPGPGDDRCIQLYEDGVREQLAGWNRPTGGLQDGQATAMGGPYEPVAGESLKTVADAGTSKPIVSEHSELTGVGGPVEAQSGYPPCSSAGPGEDRCIQLYEAGVSGAGN